MKSILNKIPTPIACIKTLIGIVICLLAPHLIEAKHIIGGEMTYRFVQDLGGGINQYEFTLVVYRDCDSGGGSLDNPASIGVFQGTAANAISIFSTTVNILPIEQVDPIFPPCADITDIFGTCVQKGTYIFTLDLPVDDNESYFVVYQRCCRTDQIVNITNPGSFGSTYMVELTPKAQMEKNNSPSFLNYPPTFICNNFPLDFDHSAIDLDGDSLAYSFCTPLTGGGQGGGNCNSPQPTPPCGPPFSTVVYTGGYTQSVPMGGMPVISIDPATGVLSGMPTDLGQYVVGICVREYRNGELIGSITRDFQFNVVDCTPTVSAEVEADEVLGIKDFLIKRCHQKDIHLNNMSVTSPDLVAWEWEFDLGSGNIFNSNTWDAVVPLPDYGEFHGMLYLNRHEDCRDSARVTIRAFPGVDVDFDYDYPVCEETPVTFSDSSISGAAGGITSWSWDFGTGTGMSSDTNPIFQFPAYGQYNVALIVRDADECADTLSKLVDWTPHPTPIIPNMKKQHVCLPDPMPFTLLDSLPLELGELVWDFGDGTFSDEISPVHQYHQPGVYDVSLAIKTAYDCYVTDTFFQKVAVYYKPVADFAFAPQIPTNLDNKVQFQNLSDTTTVYWTWEFGDGKGNHEYAPLHEYLDTGMTSVKLIAFNADGCTDTIYKPIDIVPKIRLYLPNVFAPNATAGIGNDRFGAIGVLLGYSDYHLTIWSRWGELLFETDDPYEGWNGRRGGSRVYPTGTYMYLLTLKGGRGESFHFEGTVDLIGN